jgi:hypothetical protein
LDWTSYPSIPDSFLYAQGVPFNDYQSHEINELENIRLLRFARNDSFLSFLRDHQYWETYARSIAVQGFF